MIGLLPAAGKAERIHGLPKYLLPIGDSYLLDIHVKRMLAAGCGLVYIGTNPDSFTLLNQYPLNALRYRPAHYETMTQTVLGLQEDFREQVKQALTAEYLLQEPVLFGMPDTYFEDEQVYERLVVALETASVAAALFAARPEQYAHVGMVDSQGKRIIEIIDKPEKTNLNWLWGALAWRPDFWQYLKSSDAHVGFGVQRAIEAGVDVRAVYCEGDYWDCGTPDRYFECIRSITGQGQPA